MNGLTLLVMLALGVGIVVAWRAGIAQGRRASAVAGPLKPVAQARPPVETPADVPGLRPAVEREDDFGGEQARIARSLVADNDALRLALRDACAMIHQSREFAEDRRQLLREVAAARAETARYRDLCIDLENNAAPPLLDGPNAPDDLKLIVGIGPVLERMLHQLGVSTYRQIARWSERDIDEFDARLPEFPGRIRRDAWVTQARELHQSKFGEALPVRER